MLVTCSDGLVVCARLLCNRCRTVDCAELVMGGCIATVGWWQPGAAIKVYSLLFIKLDTA